MQMYVATATAERDYRNEKAGELPYRYRSGILTMAINGIATLSVI